MRSDDSDYQVTTHFFRALGFLHDVWFNEFNLVGPVAKILVEKMPWRSSEVSEDDKDIRETQYFAHREGVRNYLSCK